MEKIVYAGSFDPLTNGHWWVIKSGLEIADKVLVFVAENPAKKTMFTANERKEMISQVALAEGLQDSIEVHIIKNEYVAAKALKMGAKYMLRGIRNQIDFDAEALLQKTNTDVIGGAKTIFVMPPRDLDSVSSSFIKSLMGPVGWHIKVRQFLPLNVYETLLKKYIYDALMSYKSEENDVELFELWEKTRQAYFAKDRHYHNYEHIVHCLQELKWYEGNVQKPNNYEMQQLTIAILGHDIVYAKKEDVSDEELSAQLVQNIWSNKNIDAVALIRTTDHLNKQTQSRNQLNFNDSKIAKLMRSIDLAILGQEPNFYKEYTKNVRKEYEDYDDLQYFAGRAKVLRGLLDKLEKDELFEHNMFKHYNEQAKINMEAELVDLSSKLNNLS